MYFSLHIVSLAMFDEHVSEWYRQNRQLIKQSSLH